MLHTSVDYIGGTIAITIITAIAHTSLGKSQKIHLFSHCTHKFRGRAPLRLVMRSCRQSLLPMKRRAIALVRADATGEACCR